MTRQKEATFFGANCLRQRLDDYTREFDTSRDRVGPAIRGDISPGYARVSAQTVSAARAILPGARIVLLIRNPIDRTWSHVLMGLALHEHAKDLRRVPVARLLRHIERTRVARYSDYGRMIELWGGEFGSSALHVETYDRISREPKPALTDILRHVGADPSRMPWNALDLSARVWAIGEVTGGQSDGLEMPEVVRWAVAKQWLEPTRRLNEQLSGRVSGWVEELERVASTKVSTPRRLHHCLNRAVLTLPERLAYAAFDRAREWRLAGAYARLQEEARMRNARRRPTPTPRQEESSVRSLATRLALAGVVSVVKGTMLALLTAVVAARQVWV